MIIYEIYQKITEIYEIVSLSIPSAEKEPHAGSNQLAKRRRFSLEENRKIT